MSSAILTWVRKVGDFLFGFDFFISYAHSDGVHYPQKLADLLQSKGFRVFLDSRVYVAGDDLRSATRRRIRMSKYLIIILRPGALESQWVLIELQRCLAANRPPIAINVNESLEQARDDNDVKLLLKDKIFITETLDQIDSEPTDETIDSIGRSFKSTRQDVIRTRAVTAAGLTLVAVAAAAAWQYIEAKKQVYEAQEQTALRYAANAERQLFQNPQESLILAAQGLTASTSDNAVEASTNAVQGALEVIRKRQEIQQNSNWGSNLFQSYIAGAWFEADLSARYNKGGELLLLSTERGKSGRNPPGDAFLLNTVTLSMKALDIPSRRRLKRRLEFVGFGETWNKIYLARQYNVEVYSADGTFQKEFSTGGGCTKYPISLVTGVLDDQLIVYGDTDGGVYTLNFETGRCESLQRKPGRILIKFDQNPSGKLAAMVFRDRTATIWNIDKEKPRVGMISFSNEAIISAWFNPQIDNQMLTAGEDGLVALWAIQGDTLRQIRVYRNAGEAIGFAMFSADGARIVAVDASNSVFIWDTVTGEILRSIVNRPLDSTSAIHVDAQAD